MAKKKELTAEERLEQALVREAEQPYAVPGNWVWVKFGYLAEDMADGPFGSNLKREHYTEKREVRIIQLSNLGEDGWRNENTKYTTYEHAKTISRSMVKAGEIVIAKMMPAGRAIKVPDLEDAYVLSSDAVKFIPKPMMNIDYLLYGINSTDFRTQISSDTQGITRARTSIGKLKSYAFPLPPLAEQQRIVDRIESLFAQLDQAKALIQEALDSFEIRKAAILHQAFTGELTKKWREEHGVGMASWEEVNLGDVVDGFKYGSSEKSDYDYEGVPVLRIPNILNDGMIDHADLKYLADNSQIDKYSLLEGDILIIRSNGSRDLVGKSAMVTESEAGYAFASYLIRMRPTKIIPHYLVVLMNSSIIRDQMFKKAKSSAGINNINTKELASLRFKLPLITEQQEIVRILDDLFEKEQAAFDLCDQIERIDTIKKTILGKAFRGELGTNMEGEACAVALLERYL